LLLLGGLGLLPGGVGLLFVVGGLLLVDGVDGLVSLAPITDPSGHVFVVGDVVDGVNICVHDGSFGVFVQSTGGGVPVVQLSTHDGPVPFPPDAATVILFVVGHVPL
jgi:hypothetical protein